MPASNSPALKKARQFADDCEERARRSHDGSAKSLYHQAAREARLCSAWEAEQTMLAMRALVAVARWYEGEGADYPPPVSQCGALPNISTQALSVNGPQPADKLSAKAAEPVPAHALNARQLAGLSGMPERTVRRAIERGVRRGLAGFYRDGCHWFAEWDAFDLARPGGRIVAD